MGPGHPRFSGNVFAMTAATVLGLSALAACTSSSNSSSTPASTSQPTGPITIGASLSLAGDFSADGQAFERPRGPVSAIGHRGDKIRIACHGAHV